MTADFNRDGRTDVMAVNGTGSTVTTILRRMTGGFTVEGSTVAAKGANYGAVADFNRDGWADVAVSGYEVPGEVAVLLRDPAGGFVKAKDSPYPVAKAGAVAVADFNGDDRMDVVASRYDGVTGNSLVVLLQKVDWAASPRRRTHRPRQSPHAHRCGGLQRGRPPGSCREQPHQRLDHDLAAQGEWSGVRPGSGITAQGRR